MGKKIRSCSGSYDYLFVKPGGNGDVHSTARKLMDIDMVREVAITEGEYGFVLKVKRAFGRQENIGKKITRVTRGSSEKVACYCQYIKG